MPSITCRFARATSIPSILRISGIGENFFAIHGTYLKNGDSPDIISCIQKTEQRKLFKINHKEYERLADHIGLFPLVMVSPYDRDLINEGSDVGENTLMALYPSSIEFTWMT